MCKRALVSSILCKAQTVALGSKPTFAACAGKIYSESVAERLLGGPELPVVPRCPSPNLSGGVGLERHTHFDFALYHPPSFSQPQTLVESGSGLIAWNYACLKTAVSAPTRPVECKLHCGAANAATLKNICDHHSHQKGGIRIITLHKFVVFSKIDDPHQSDDFTTTPDGKNISTRDIGELCNRCCIRCNKSPLLWLDLQRKQSVKIRSDDRLKRHHNPYPPIR